MSSTEAAEVEEVEVVEAAVEEEELLAEEVSLQADRSVRTHSTNGFVRYMHGRQTASNVISVRAVHLAPSR